MMHRSPVISTQVVNEFLNVLLVKRQLDRPSAYELARALMQGCDVIAVMVRPVLVRPSRVPHHAASGVPSAS